MLILHITKSRNWKEALSKGTYETESLASQGFIHCSTLDQIVEVSNSIFYGKKGFVLLCINTNGLKSKVKIESGADKFYPHIYGPLNLDAVIGVFDFEPGDDGKFALPPEIIELAKSLDK